MKEEKNYVEISANEEVRKKYFKKMEVLIYE